MPELGETIVNCSDVSVFYGDTRAINNISIDIERQSITSSHQILLPADHF